MIGNDELEKFGCKWSIPNDYNIQEFAWRDWGKPWKLSGYTASRSKFDWSSSLIQLYRVVLLDHSVQCRGCDIGCLWVATFGLIENLLWILILKHVFGPVMEQRVWRIRTNQELREFNESFDLVADGQSGWGMWLCSVKKGWMRTFFKIRRKLKEKWDVWKIQRMIYMSWKWWDGGKGK
jgi:hypothetical protein